MLLVLALFAFMPLQFFPAVEVGPLVTGAWPGPCGSCITAGLLRWASGAHLRSVQAQPGGGVHARGVAAACPAGARSGSTRGALRAVRSVLASSRRLRDGRVGPAEPRRAGVPRDRLRAA